MKTKVFTQYNGGSGLDARYVGTVHASPKEVVDRLRTIETVSHVEVFDDSLRQAEVIAYGNRPF